MRPSTQLMFHSLCIAIMGMAIFLLGMQIENIRTIIQGLQERQQQLELYHE